MNKFISKFSQGFLTFFLISGSTLQAAPGTISPTPLIVSSAIDPNIMLLFDNSGSMNNIVPESPYDEATTYFNCPAATAITIDPDPDGNGSISDNESQVDVIVKSTGEVFFIQETGVNLKLYRWNTSVGSESFDMSLTANYACFDANENYSARLLVNDDALDNDGNKYFFPFDYGRGQYSGNYLNWYFSNATQTGSANFGIGAEKKPGTSTRSEIAKVASVEIINKLASGNTPIRIGLATYNYTGDSGTSGAKIEVGIDDIGINKANVTAAINAIDNNGATPLAGALKEIGRYFIEGHQSEIITLHPGTAPINRTASDVFDTEPAYANILDKPTTAKSVIKAFCQPNYLIALTDGRPSEDTNVNTDLEDYDGDCAGGACDTDLTAIPPFTAGEDRKPGRDYADDGADYIDDVAQALHEIDLRPNLTDFNGDAVLNNITTYLVGFADDQVIGDPLLKETADQGGGLFLTASDQASLEAALDGVTSDVLASVGTAASVAFNSTSLGIDTAVFFARFNSNKWSGELFAVPIESDGSIRFQTDSDGNVVIEDGIPVFDHDWEASEELDGIDATSRVILTYDGTDGIPFRWADLTAATDSIMEDDLNIDENGVTDTNGSARLDYIRGDDSNEGDDPGEFRERDGKLSDIVTSTPVYVGAPGLNYPNASPFGPGTVGTLYSDFVSSASGRAPIVYVGANDAKVHGFDARLKKDGSGTSTGGDEVFAYVPKSLYSTSPSEGLHYLSDQDYAHRFYVDLSPTVSDVYIKTSASGTADWRTVLIGGLGAGGEGIYALDVTNPASFSEAASAAIDTVLWEFTSADDADLGLTYSKPVIAMMNNDKWAVIFGNGYNNKGDGRAKLFIVFIEEGVDGTWSAGEYIKIDTEVGTALDINGLSSLAVADIDANRTLDYIYAGDLQGNLWAFDVTASNDGNWKVSYKSGTTPLPLFKAADSNGNAQPITAAPVLVRNTAQPSGGDPNLLVLFGTGQYLTQGDLTDKSDHSFYAVWDHGSSKLTRSDLVERTFSEDATSSLRTIDSGSPVDFSMKDGWFHDFDLLAINDGERIVTSPLVRGDVLFFNTLIPNNDIPCASGGVGFLMSLDPQTGLAPAFGVFDANNDGDIDDKDIDAIGEKVFGLPSRSGILGDKQYTPTSQGTLEDRSIDTGGDTRLGRLAWEELVPDL